MTFFGNKMKKNYEQNLIAKRYICKTDI